MPDFRFENECGDLVAGIDEAGRGPLAGPVVAAAVIFDRNALPRSLRRRIDDSKALTRAQREAAFIRLQALRTAGGIQIGIGAASVAEIDRINILQATFLAMRRAVSRLGTMPAMALVDGNRSPPLPCPARAIVDGDALCLSIAAASIVAKVVRDTAMLRLAARYPGFGWQTNVGYGTPEHLAGLAARGATRHHRASFAPLRQLEIDFSDG